MDAPKKPFSTWYKIQSYFNIINHILNGSISIFMTLYIFREGWDSFAWHVFFTTLGYQLLMAEAIMVFYSPNSWTFFHSYKTKKNIHLVLQLIATILIVTGNIIISAIRTTPHFKTVHAITGKSFLRDLILVFILNRLFLGLTSMVFLVLSVLQGVWSYYAFELRSFVKPVKSKFMHNITSVICFVIGMISLITGYTYGISHDLFLSQDVEYTMKGIAIVTTILSLIGAMKSNLSFLKTSN